MISVSVEKILFVFLLLGYFRRNGVLSFSQDELSYMANNVQIHYEVVDNLEDSSTYRSRITLTNKGKKQIELGPWAIYFNFIRLIEPKHLMNNPSGYILQKVGVKLSHITGSLFKLEPVKGFKALSLGKSLEFDFESQYFSVARTDIMPNWYIVAEGLEAMNISSTTGEELKFVGKFDTIEKWKRAKNDLYNPFTPEQRLQRIKVEESKPNHASIIPTPVELNVVEGVQYVNITNWVIVSSTEFETEASYLGKKLKLCVKHDTGSSRHTNIFRLLKENVDVSVDDKGRTRNERYKVEVNARENIITISGPEASGIFYGIQSLLAVTDVERKQVRMISLKDAPRFEYRGLMLDIARNFHGKITIMKILDVMGKYKLNKLHLHLTDDEGWRLEIPGLEELTKFGGKRCHNTSMCLAPQIGSGARTGNSGSGYLSVQDYKEILQHAKTLHIEIIPEIDMPGHSHAAIKAMEYRFLKYNSSANETVRKDASKFLLTEIGDPSSYFSVQMFRDNAVNPCLNSTYNFIEQVVSTLVNIHKDISPLKVFHMGGDEVAKGAWINSTACQNLLTVNKDIELKKYFTKRLSEITQKYNINFAAWEDGLIENEKIFNKSQLFSNSDVFSYAWDNVWEWGKFNRAYRLANAGYKTVLAHATHLYFDMPYEPDPEERGYYWATRFTDTKKTFGYMPDDVYDNAKEERFGKQINKTELCMTQDICSPLVKKSNIVGIQGHLWSETVRTEDQLFYLCFPRVLALAERAWHKAKFEKENGQNSREEKFNMEWQKFANLLGFNELRNLDEMRVNYRVPLPGAKIESGRLVASSAFPGLKIEYKSNGGEEWKEYTLAESKLSGKVRLRTKSADGSHYSREIEMNVPISHHSHGTRSKIPAGIVQLVMFISIFLYTT